MNKGFLIKTGLASYLLISIAAAQGRVIDLSYRKENFSISTRIPPASLYVEDSLGRRTGIDPAYISKIDQYGILVDQKGFLYDIPSSDIDQQNFASDDAASAPMPFTPTLIDIGDGGNQTYTINLVGITEGVQRITVQDAPAARNAPNAPQNIFFILTQPNEVKQVKVTVNANAYTTSITRVVGSSGLLNDVKTACQLNLITSHHVCKRLEEKAEAIQDVLEKHHYEEAEKLVWVFLHSLGDSRPEGCKEEDHHDAVKEPALTILKEDAKALLAQIEQEEKHHHYGDHGDNDHHQGDDKR